MVYKKNTNDVRYTKPDDEPIWTFRYEPMFKWESKINIATCFCCGSKRNIDSFPLTPDNTWSNVDWDGRPHAMVCLGCMEAVYKRYIEQDIEKNKYKALYRICMFANYYYDDRIAHRVIEEDGFYPDGTPVPEKMGVVDRYIRTIMNDDKLKTKTFWKSDNLIWEDVLAYQYNEGALSEQDLKNRRQILTIYHYDPFERETPEDRPRLMEDLLTMTDDSMADDLVRQKAAIEIVKSFNRTNKIDASIIELQKTTEDVARNSKTIKELIETKKKETDMITSFSKDHGFAEKYALSKSKGSGTLSAIVRDMNENGYDQGAVNRFDVATANAIRQVAEISAEAIMKQLNLQENDYVEIVKLQNIKFSDLQAKYDKKCEELRLLKEKFLKEELLNEYRKDLLNKGITQEEANSIVEEQERIPTQYRMDTDE